MEPLFLTALYDMLVSLAGPLLDGLSASRRSNFHGGTKLEVYSQDTRCWLGRVRIKSCCCVLPPLLEILSRGKIVGSPKFRRSTWPQQRTSHAENEQKEPKEEQLASGHVIASGPGAEEENNPEKPAAEAH